MDRLTLALIVSYLDGLQARREWQPPRSKWALARIWIRYSVAISPSTRRVME